MPTLADVNTTSLDSDIVDELDSELEVAVRLAVQSSKLESNELVVDVVWSKKTDYIVGTADVLAATSIGYVETENGEKEEENLLVPDDEDEASDEEEADVVAMLMDEVEEGPDEDPDAAELETAAEELGTAAVELETAAVELAREFCAEVGEPA